MCIPGVPLTQHCTQPHPQPPLMPRVRCWQQACPSADCFGDSERKHPLVAEAVAVGMSRACSPMVMTEGK